MARAAYAIVVSSNASKIAFSSAADNDGCFAHIQLSRKSAQHCNCRHRYAANHDRADGGKEADELLVSELG